MRIPAPTLLLALFLGLGTSTHAAAQVNEADSLALVAFIATTDVETSQTVNQGRTAWGDGPVHLWAGVTVRDGRVIGLTTPLLSGTLPDELGNEDALKALEYFLASSGGEAGLTGSIPAWLGNLENLGNLQLFGNRFSGLIPASLGRLSKLFSLGLGENELEGFEPGAYDGWTSLQTIAINGNNIHDLPDLRGLPALQTLWVYLNPLTFDDLEPLVDLVGTINFRYWPLRTVETLVDAATGTLSVDMGGTRTAYKWYRAPFVFFNPPIGGANGPAYRPQESGAYYCIGEHPEFPDLKLRSEEASVEAGPLTLVVNDPGDFLDLTPGDGICETDPTAPGEQCTLRAALETVNALGTDGFTISFNIPGTAVPKLIQFTELPAIERSVIIDGTTQAAGRVEISGESAEEGASGLILLGGTSTVRGLVINRFPRHGLVLRTRGGNTVENTFIGTDAAGTGALGNGGIGLWIEASSAGNQIGGNTPAQQNRISASGDAGILVAGISNKIQGNIIGAPESDMAGTLGNGEDGIRVEGASNTIIGGTGAGEGNLIHANKGNGIVVYGGGALPEARNITIRRNRIYGNTGLGIDLGGDGVTANDLGDPSTVDDDEGPNDLINFPTGITATPDPNDASKLLISGFVETPFAHLTRVELYASSKPHTSGFGEGEVFIAEAAVQTEGNFLVTVNQSDVPFPFLSGTTIGFEGTTSEFSAVCGDPDGDGHPDSDGDGLCDDWETNGLDYDGNGTIDLPLHEAPFIAHARRKDLFVEIDWMKAADHDHEPVAEGLTDVRNAFARAPALNPDGTSGIRLHLMPDEPVQHFDNIRFNTKEVKVPEDGTFNEIKMGEAACGTEGTVGRFGTAADRAASNCYGILGARRLVFRYVIYGHNHAHNPGSSGISELPGNDTMVTIGGWSEAGMKKSGGSMDLTEARRHVEAGTFMHEFGHALGLRHGGADNLHCKPNYLSVMNYLLQARYFIPNRPLDYTRTAQADLNEAALSEATGLDGPVGRFIYHNSSPITGVAVTPFERITTDQHPVDWNRDGVINPGTVAADLNYMFLPPKTPPCGLFDADTNADGKPDSPGLIVLRGHDDWANIQYTFRTSPDFADGADRETVPVGEENEEITEEEATEAAEAVDFDGDGIVNAEDNCSSIANPNQEDANADDVGDVCENVGLMTIAVSPQQVVLTPGETVQFTGYGFDMLGLETPVTPTWSAEGGSIDGTGLYTADQEVGVYMVTATSADGLVAGTAKVEVAKVVSVEEEVLPTSFSLARNYPNPFNPATTIEYGLPSSEHVTLRVYDVLGREVAVLVDALQAAGTHQARFDAGDLPSGAYLYRLTAGPFSKTRVMLLVR